MVAMQTVREDINMSRTKGSKNRNPILIEDRFWEKVDKKGENECWEWGAYIHHSGYGHIQIGRNSYRAHRISWELNVGEIPEGMCVLHTCDNRICVNPNHLFLGTYKDNAVDRDKKKRGVIPDNSGENHGMSKLKEEDIFKIRYFYRRGKSPTEIAKWFPVDRRTVSKIVNRKAWTHI